MSEVEVLRLRAEVAELRLLIQALTERVSALEGEEDVEVVPRQAAPPLSTLCVPDRGGPLRLQLLALRELL